MARLYDTGAWKAARRAALKRAGYRCSLCGVSVAHRGASRVDHIQPVRTHPHLALNPDNLRVLCVLHDNQSHREKWRGKGAARAREQKFTGSDVRGFPIDPAHHWRGPENYDF